MLHQGNGGEAARSLPMQETEGVRDQNTTWKLRGKTQAEGEMVRDSFTECAPHPPATPGSSAVQGLLSPGGRTRGG